MKNVANAKVTLTDYDLTNPQIFSRQLNLVDDIATVRVINKSLETLRSMQNMLISQESPEAKDIVDIPEISNLIKRHAIVLTSSRMSKTQMTAKA